jgi:[ribosomal protein S18]-alanine N-acetyltransferase
MVVERAREVQTAVSIERMRIEDVDEVAALDEQCFPIPWSASAYITEIHNASAYYIVAKLYDRVVGYAGVWLIMDEAHITTLGVDPQYRGRRIGERLLLDLLSEAIHRGGRRATLEVRRHNKVAQNLYEKYHFHAVAVRKAYYTNNHEDALILWIDDMHDPEFLKALSIGRERLQENR